MSYSKYLRSTAVLAVSTSLFSACGGGGSASVNTADPRLVSYIGNWGRCVAGPNNSASRWVQFTYEASGDSQLTYTNEAVIYFSGSNCDGERVLQVETVFEPTSIATRSLRTAALTAQSLNTTGQSLGDTTVDVFDSHNPAASTQWIGNYRTLGSEPELVTFTDDTGLPYRINLAPTTAVDTVRYLQINAQGQLQSYNLDSTTAQLTATATIYTKQAQLKALDATASIIAANAIGDWTSSCNHDPNYGNFSYRVALTLSAVDASTVAISREISDYFDNNTCAGAVYAQFSRNFDGTASIKFHPAQQTAELRDSAGNSLGLTTVTLATFTTPDYQATFSGPFSLSGSIATVRFSDGTSVSRALSGPAQSGRELFNVNARNQVTAYEISSTSNQPYFLAYATFTRDSQ